jgi:hypothetical protein
LVLGRTRSTYDHILDEGWRQEEAFLTLTHPIGGRVGSGMGKVDSREVGTASSWAGWLKEVVGRKALRRARIQRKERERDEIGTDRFLR